jgi:hypothetical protein
MPESTTDRSIVEGPSDEATAVKQEWKAPVLTMLGEARSLTEAGGMADLDSPTSSMS